MKNRSKIDAFTLAYLNQAYVIGLLFLLASCFFIPVISQPLPHFYRSGMLCLIISVALIISVSYRKEFHFSHLCLPILFLFLLVLAQHIFIEKPFPITQAILQFSYFLFAFLCLFVFSNFPQQLSSYRINQLIASVLFILILFIVKSSPSPFPTTKNSDSPPCDTIENPPSPASIQIPP